MSMWLKIASIRTFLERDEKSYGSEIAKSLQGLSELIVWTFATLCAWAA